MTPMNTTNNTFSEYAGIIIKFIGAFAVFCIVLGIAGVSGLANAWTESLAHQTSWALTTCGLENTVSGNIITLPGRSLAVILECTAVFIMMTYGAMVLAYPFKLRTKLMALLIGVPVIYVVNFLRLIAVGLLSQSVTGEWFNIIHDYFFQLGMVLVTILVWLSFLYLDRSREAGKRAETWLSAEFLRRVLLVIVWASAVELMLYLFSQWSPAFPPLSYTSVLAPTVGLIAASRNATIQTKFIWAGLSSIVVIALSWVLVATALPTLIGAPGMSLAVSILLSVMYCVMWIGVPILIAMMFVSRYGLTSRD